MTIYFLRLSPRHAESTRPKVKILKNEVDFGALCGVFRYCFLESSKYINTCDFCVFANEFELNRTQANLNVPKWTRPNPNRIFGIITELKEIFYILKCHYILFKTNYYLFDTKFRKLDKAPKRLKFKWRFARKSRKKNRLLKVWHINPFFWEHVLKLVLLQSFINFLCSKPNFLWARTYKIAQIRRFWLFRKKSIILSFLMKK